MKKLIGLFTILFLILSCKNEEKHESIYFFYRGYGDKIVKMQYLLFKNSEKSYYDTTIMEIGKPLEIKIGLSEINNLVNSFPKDCFYENGTPINGIISIHYIEQKKVGVYLFKDSLSIKKLIKSINKHIENKKTCEISVSWIESVQKLYLTRPRL